MNADAQRHELVTIPWDGVSDLTADDLVGGATGKDLHPAVLPVLPGGRRCEVEPAVGRSFISRQADIRCSPRNFVALRDEQQSVKRKVFSSNRLRLLVILLLQIARMSQTGVLSQAAHVSVRKTHTKRERG